MLGQLLGEDPLCLAAVDAVVALDAVTTAPTEVSWDLERILRRAAYGSDGSYATRAAQLEFHARLAGSIDLADVFARPAAEHGSWDTPWRVGGPSAAIPDGDPLTTKAVLPVSWPAPAAVIIDEDFNAELLDLVTRSPLGPRVGLRDAAGRAPDVWSAREIAGSVHLVAAQEEGDIRTWCLAGPLASSEVRAAGPQPRSHPLGGILPWPRRRRAGRRTHCGSSGPPRDMGGRHRRDRAARARRSLGRRPRGRVAGNRHSSQAGRRIARQRPAGCGDHGRRCGTGCRPRH